MHEQRVINLRLEHQELKKNHESRLFLNDSPAVLPIKSQQSSPMANLTDKINIKEDQSAELETKMKKHNVKSKEGKVPRNVLPKILAMSTHVPNKPKEIVTPRSSMEKKASQMTNVLMSQRRHRKCQSTMSQYACAEIAQTYLQKLGPNAESQATIKNSIDRKYKHKRRHKSKSPLKITIDEDQKPDEFISLRV